MDEFKSEFQKMQAGKFDEVNFNKLKSFFGMIAKQVDIQRKRIGGNFAVAHAVTSEELREHIRNLIPDVIFITLSLTKESQMKRIQARHGEKSEGVIKMLTGIYDMYELPGKNEKNTFNVDITDEMSPNDVVKKVQNILADK